MNDVLLTLKTKYAALSVGRDGILLSLKEAETGRELAHSGVPLWTAELEDGTVLSPTEVTEDDALFAVTFGDRGTLRVRMEAREEYFFFSVSENHIPNLKTLAFLRIHPVPVRYFGIMGGFSSDDESGICLRSLSLEGNFRKNGDVLELFTEKATGFLSPGGLAAGARNTLIPALRAMVQQENVPLSLRGGPFSLGSEYTKGSYLFVDLTCDTLGDWIAMAKRGGFSCFHIHWWWEWWGHYQPRKAAYPKGFSQIRECADKIHQAGIMVGMHMLSGCINPEDPWIHPEAPADLINHHEYTLAEDLSADADRVPVQETPAADHSLFFTYSGSGNVLRIGSELIQYSGIEGKCFTKCTRGAFGTTISAHKKGELCGYLQQRYLAFYPKPDSPLAHALVVNISACFKACKADMIYMDGSEGMRSRYGIDWMRKNLFLAVRPALVESSCLGHNNWWFHSRLGARDVPAFAQKQFVDLHIHEAEQYRKAEFMEPQMGWWATRPAEDVFRCNNPDDSEYLNLKSLLEDSPVAVQSTRHGREYEIFTRTGWYERLRKAGYFKKSSLTPAQGDDADSELSLRESGEWQFRRRTITRQLNESAKPETCLWTFRNGNKKQPLCFRMEALTAPDVGKEGLLLADFVSRKPDISACAEGVTFQTYADGTYQEKPVFRIQAENKNAPRNGSWVRVSHKYPSPYFNADGTNAMGIWVRGDSSNALLNVQMHSAPEFAGSRSDHYIRLNFTGWKYFALLLRERCTDQVHHYQWPYSVRESNFSIYHTALCKDRLEHIDEISVYLNDIPLHGKADVSILPVRGIGSHPVTLKNPVLTLNGTDVVLPVTLHTGEMLELTENGYGTVYDKLSTPVQTIGFPNLPELKAGENTFSLRGEGEFRCETALFTFGEFFGESSPEFKTEEMALEYTMPVPVTNSVHPPVRLIRRKNAPDPTLTLELLVKKAEAPIREIRFQIGTQSISVPAELLENQRLTLSGNGWQVQDSAGKILNSGTLPEPLPRLEINTDADVQLTCSGKHLVWFSAMKNYGEKE